MPNNETIIKMKLKGEKYVVDNIPKEHSQKNNNRRIPLSTIAYFAGTAVLGADLIIAPIATDGKFAHDFLGIEEKVSNYLAYGGFAALIGVYGHQFYKSFIDMKRKYIG